MFSWSRLLTTLYSSGPPPPRARDRDSHLFIRYMHKNNTQNIIFDVQFTYRLLESNVPHWCNLLWLCQQGAKYSSNLCNSYMLTHFTTDINKGQSNPYVSFLLSRRDKNPLLNWNLRYHFDIREFADSCRAGIFIQILHVFIAIQWTLTQSSVNLPVSYLPLSSPYDRTFWNQRLSNACTKHMRAWQNSPIHHDK